MNHVEIIALVTNATGMLKRDATKAVDAIFEAITAELFAGGEVALVNFGAFSVSESADRQGRNPKTGEAIEIAASGSPKFKAGKGLRDAVNQL